MKKLLRRAMKSHFGEKKGRLFSNDFGRKGKTPPL